jgi:hypothetical protein
MRVFGFLGRVRRCIGMCQMLRVIMCGSRPAWALAVVVCFVVAGCSGQEKPAVARYPVRGTVTLDGSPLPDGRITLITVAAGHADAMAIKDGHFEGQAAAGERRVEFSVVKNVKASGPPIPGMPETVPQETLPGQFNSETKYKVTVVPDGVNDFTFDLKNTAR